MNRITWLPGFVPAVLIVACFAGVPSPAAAGDLIAHFHGNYCGNEASDPTFRKRPIDALDAACMRHDRCYLKHPNQTCGCNERLAAETGRLAQAPRLSEDLHQKARILETVFSVLSCW